MPKTTAEKIASKDEQIQQLINQKKQLLQKKKADERKARNNRLYRRHGLLEKYMPGLTVITDRQFEMFIKRAINTKYGRDILIELVNATGKSVDCIYNETTDEYFTEDGASTPKAEPSGA